MILANVRTRLTREDAQLVVRLVSRGSSRAIDAAEATLSDSGLDPLLDDPGLLDGLLSSRQGAHASLPLFAYVVVRHALRTEGEEDRGLADYVASILLHFGLRQRANQVREHDDATYDTLTALAAELESADASRAFLVRAHLGNYALWQSGMFPDHIEFRRWRRGGPDLDFFDEMGSRGFRLAADHQLANEHGLKPLFQLASAHFPQMRRALNHVSDRLLFPNVHTPDRLMRQVKDLVARDASRRPPS